MSSDHERWDELAAGHALDALEPEETETFTAHLAECRRCQQAVDEHAFVAAQLGTLLSDDDEAPSWKQVRRGVLPEPPVSLDAERSRRQRSARLVAVAASVVVLLVTAIAVLLAADRSPSSQEQVLALCAASTSCHVVHLQGRADVVVTDASVRVLPKSLGEPPAGRVFVLWQLPRDGRPTMVGTLQTTADGTVGESHPLALPYDSTAAFGVSSEPASVVPTAPTDVVVLGET